MKDYGYRDVGWVFFLLVFLPPVVAWLLIATDADAHKQRPHRYPVAVSVLDPNLTRASYGLPLLTVDRQLTRDASHYAREMCRTGDFRHDTNILRSGYTRVGENLGRSSDIHVFRAAFEDSPSHLANLIDPDYTTYGVGLCRRGADWYVVYRFGDPLGR